MTTEPREAPVMNELPAERIRAYIEGRKDLRGIDYQSIHSAWVRQEDAPRTLTVADLEALLAENERLRAALSGLAAELVGVEAVLTEASKRLDRAMALLPRAALEGATDG